MSNDKIRTVEKYLRHCFPIDRCDYLIIQWSVFKVMRDVCLLTTSKVYFNVAFNFCICHCNIRITKYINKNKFLHLRKVDNLESQLLRHIIQLLGCTNNINGEKLIENIHIYSIQAWLLLIVLHHGPIIIIILWYNGYYLSIIFDNILW